MVREKLFNRSALAMAVCACAMLSACGHTNGFSLAATEQATGANALESAGDSGAAPGANGGTMGAPTGNPSNPGGGGGGGGGGSIGGSNVPLSGVLYAPVSALAGEGVAGLGARVSALGDILPTNALDRPTQGVGQVLSNVGNGLSDNGLGSLPVFGDAANSLIGQSDTTTASMFSLTAGGQTIGGENPFLGLGVMDGAAAPGSTATLSLLDAGNAASLSTLPVLGQPIGADLSGTGLGNLGSLASVNTPTQSIGGSNSMIAVNTGGQSASGSLMTASLPVAGNLGGTGLAPIAPPAVAVPPVVGSTLGNIGGVVSGATGGTQGALQNLLGF